MFDLGFISCSKTLDFTISIGPVRVKFILFFFFLIFTCLYTKNILSLFFDYSSFGGGLFGITGRNYWGSWGRIECWWFVICLVFGQFGGLGLMGRCSYLGIAPGLRFSLCSLLWRCRWFRYVFFNVGNTS